MMGQFKQVGDEVIPLTPEELQEKLDRDAAWAAGETARKLALLAHIRWQKEVGGITVEDFSIDTSDRSKILICSMYVDAAGKDPAATRKFKSATGEIEITNAQVVAIGQAVADHVQRGINAELAVAAYIGVVDDIEAAFTAEYEANAIING